MRMDSCTSRKSFTAITVSHMAHICSFQILWRKHLWYGNLDLVQRLSTVKETRHARLHDDLRGVGGMTSEVIDILYD